MSDSKTQKKIEPDIPKEARKSEALRQTRNKAKKKIEAARCQLLMDWDVFGSLITYLKPKEVSNYRAPMGTDGKQVFYNPEMIAEMPLDEIEGSCAHEVSHCALGHLWRKENREERRWNAATDLVVNLMVRDYFSLPDGILCDPKFRDMSAEQVYNELPELPELSGCPQCGSKNLHGRPVEKVGPDRYRFRISCPECDYTEDKIGKLEKGEGSEGGGEISVPPDWRVLDDHGKWGEAQGGEGEKEEDEKRALMSPEELEEEWKRRTARVVQSAKIQGTLPAGLDRLVKDLLYPKVDWRVQLQRYVTSMGRDCADWKRPNRKFLKRKFYFPTLRSEQLEVAFAVDTSGSVSDDELRDFLSEVKGALNAFPSFKARLLACDADVHADAAAESIQEFDDFTVEVSGRGGTSFVPVFDRLEKESIRALIYLTDGYGSFPDKLPHFDVLWLINNGDVDPPFGQVIRL